MTELATKLLLDGLDAAPPADHEALLMDLIGVAAGMLIAISGKTQAAEYCFRVADQVVDSRVGEPAP